MQTTITTARIDLDAFGRSGGGRGTTSSERRTKPFVVQQTSFQPPRHHRHRRFRSTRRGGGCVTTLSLLTPRATQWTRGHIRRREHNLYVEYPPSRSKNGRSVKALSSSASSTASSTVKSKKSNMVNRTKSSYPMTMTKAMNREGKKQTMHLGGRSVLVCASSSTTSLSSKGDKFVIPFKTIVSILAVMLAAFFHLLGFTATGPITPELVKHFDIPGSKIGYLTSAYPLGMFFALFLWPRLSDLQMVGRKKVMTLSLLGVGTFLLAQAKCVSLGYSFETFLTLRVLAGCCAGASPVIKAYLADIGTNVSASMRVASNATSDGSDAATTATNNNDTGNTNNNNAAVGPKRYEHSAFTARLMGWREACCTLAFVVGPTVGGIICSGLNLSATIAFTGYASILASVLVFLLVVEPSNAHMVRMATNGDEDKNKNEGGTSNSSGTNTAALYDSQNLSCPLGVSVVAAVGTICVTSFLYNAGQSTFDSFFPIVISKTAGMGPTMIGATLTSLSLVSLSISTLLFAPIFKFFGLAKTCGIGLAFVATGLAMIGISTTAFTTGLGAFFYVCGVPLFTPSIPILLMQCVPTTSRGAVMGFDSAINSSARIITPVLLGSVFAASRGRAFLFAAACVAAAFVIVVTRSLLVFRETRVNNFSTTAR